MIIENMVNDQTDDDNDIGTDQAYKHNNYEMIIIIVVSFPLNQLSSRADSLNQFSGSFKKTYVRAR